MKEKSTNSEKLFAQLQSLPEFCESFLIGRKNERALTTRLSYARDLVIFFDFLLNTHPFFCELTAKDIQAADMKNVTVMDMDKFLELFGDKHSPKTTARMQTAISTMFDYLTNVVHAIEYNPVTGSQRIKIPEKDFVIYLTIEEQNKLLDTIRYGTGLTKKAMETHGKYIKRDLAMIFLFLDTGIRVSEMQGIDNSDLDLEECSMIIQRKGGKISKVYFSDEACDYIRDYMEEKKALLPAFCGLDDPFLISEQGNRLSVRQIQNIVPKYVTAALPEKKEHISPHKLRSSFALSFYMRPAEEGGRDILTLQRLMNHKSIQTTNIYAKASENISKENRNWRKKS